MNDTLPVNYHALATPELVAQLRITTAMLMREKHPDFKSAARKRLVSIRTVLRARVEMGE